jgi:predicted transcriptional regulator
MKKVTTDDRQLIHRLLNAGYTVKEVGKILGRTEKTVRERIQGVPEDPYWLPSMQYLESLGFKVGLQDNNTVELKHSEGISYVPYALVT